MTGRRTVGQAPDDAGRGGGAADAIRLAPYTEAWARAFETEAERLRAVFGTARAEVRHIGSTSVPGLVAKPIIDVLVGLSRLEEAEARIQDMEALGYQYVPEYEAELPDRRYFRRPRTRPRAYHVHCVVEGGWLWRRHLAFRDHLRAHPSDALRYGRLKRALAGRCGADRGAYLEGKAPFIAEVLKRAGADR